MDNILDIIYEYSKNFRILDLSAIDKIMATLLQINDLEQISCNMITKKHFLFSQKELGYFVSNNIYLYINNIRNRVIKDKHIIFKKEEQLPIFQYVLRQNIDIAHTLFHEIEHAIQNKMLAEKNDDNMEKHLLRIEQHFIDNALNKITFYDTIDMLERIIPGSIDYSKDMKLYQRNYSTSIMERLADEHSLTKIKNLVFQIKNEAPELYELIDDIKLMCMMKSYIELNDKRKDKNIIYSPTIEFVDNLGYLNKLYELDINNLSYNDRFKYGLCLTKDEYDNNDNRLKKLLK